VSKRREEEIDFFLKVAREGEKRLSNTDRGSETYTHVRINSASACEGGSRRSNRYHGQLRADGGSPGARRWAWATPSKEGA
jgi:hypothetical protein